MTRRTITASIITVLLTLLLTACNDNKVFDTYIHTDENGWEKNDAILFNIDTLKTSGMYSMTLGMRISKEYPFKNLQIIVDQTIYPSMETRSDIINCRITDRNGLMLGHGVSMYQYLIPIRKDTYNQGDSIQLRVRHNMKREILPGIIDVGMIVKKDI